MVIAYPALEPIYVLKAYISNGFYRIELQPTDAPKMVLVSPSYGRREEVLSIPRTLPM